MINVTDLRAGITFELDGEPMIVLKYEHVKVGRGTASIRVKVRNIKTGSVTEKSFISGARVEPLTVSKKKYQFLYTDGVDYNFMDPKTFDQISIPAEIVGDQGSYLKEGITIDVNYLEDQPLGIELPSKMEFTVAETGPGVKGNSATNIFKSAVLDNGVTIKIPLFVDEGEKILIDTRTGAYLERVKS